jgi:hypothetical protein
MVVSPATSPGTRGGRSEQAIVRHPATGREIWQMTRSAQASLHSYYDLCPWSPDGTKLVFCAAAPDGSGSEVYWMEAGNSGVSLHFVGHSSAWNPHTGVHQQWIGGRGNGTGEPLIGFEDRDASGRFVRIVDLSGSAVGRVEGTMRMVSSDGHRVASHTDPRDEAAILRRETAGVFIGGLDPRGERPAEPQMIVSLAQALAANPRRDEIADRHLYIKHAKWSPSGNRLSFVFTNEISYERLYNEPRVKDIYVVDADGGNLRYVCDFSLGHHPSWHPNGRMILLNRRESPGAPMRFLLADADTGAVEVATDLIDGGGHPSFSPDGTRIVTEYVTGRHGEGRVVCVDLVRRRVEELVRFPLTDHSHDGTHIHPVWSRDGRAVLYNSDQSGHAELYVVPLE